MLNSPKYCRELRPPFTRHLTYRARYQAFAYALTFTPMDQTIVMKRSLIWEFMNAVVHHDHIFIRIGNSRHPQFTFSNKDGSTFTFFILCIAY
jgi:hypothetical protein